MTARDLLAALRVDGVCITANGDRLTLDAPKGLLTPEQLDQVRALKPGLLALLAKPEPGPEPVSVAASASPAPVEDTSFLEMVEDARRFQAEGRPGPWAAFTMDAEALDGAIGGLSLQLREEFDLRIGIYGRDGLSDDHARRIALFLLADEHQLSVGEA